MKPFLLKIIIVAMVFLLCHKLEAQSKKVFDIVLMGGRVIDPETKLDAIRNIGISKGRIASISTNALLGKEVIDVKGLVVAPGFIDMHVHGRSNQEQEFQLHDGLTTTLELEWGVENIEQWYASRSTKAIITKVKSTRLLMSSALSWIKLLASSVITFLRSSALFLKSLLNIKTSIGIITANTTSTIGAMWIRNELKSKSALEAMMMFGGSPIKVAAPPMLEIKTSARINGTG